MRRYILIALLASAGCSGARQDNAARAVAASDSVAIVRAAAAALHDSSGTRFVVSQFQPADSSSYLVSLVPAPSRDAKVRVTGGGGLVVVNSRHETRVIRLYR